MLKGIPSIISPELLKILMEMGHGDEIIIADGNFPGASLANKLVRLDGHSGPEVLEAVLKLLPLDTYTDNFVLMEKMECDKNMEIPVWKESINVVGNELFYMQAVHQESDVVPENIDAIRALLEMESDNEKSIAKTNKAMGIF